MASSPHLQLETSKDCNNKPWKTPFFRVDVELDTRPQVKQHMILCVCVCVCVCVCACVCVRRCLKGNV